MSQTLVAKSNTHFWCPSFCGSAIQAWLSRVSYCLWLFCKTAVKVSVRSKVYGSFGQERACFQVHLLGCWWGLDPEELRELRPSVLSGCWLEAVFNSLPCEPLQQVNLLHPSQQKSLIGRGKLVFCNFIMKVIAHKWCCILLVRSKLLREMGLSRV